MAATVAVVREGFWLGEQEAGYKPGTSSQPTRWAIVDITPDNHYDVGGIACDIAGVLTDFTTLLSVRVGNSPTHAYYFDATNANLEAVVIATGAEVAHTTDLSAQTVTAFVVGY